MTDSGSVRILCIEDNPINWRLVQRLLGQAGFEVHWAEDGIQGFDMALSLMPDLVLLDINLPGLSGFETATKFRQQAELRTTPIIALTAKTLKSDRETALVAGCDGFIPKPIDPFTFVKQVNGYLEGRREQVDAVREGAVLRNLSAQMVEHLEAQLRVAQDTNAKLLATQRDLQTRNQSLGRLLALSQSILTEHDPLSLSALIFEEVRGELKVSTLYAYRSHQSMAYLEGVCWNGEALEPAPVLPSTSPFYLKAQVLPKGVPLHGEGLRANRLWEDGVAHGFWPLNGEACLIVLQDSQASESKWGVWVMSRAEPFLPLELEMLAMFASMALVSRENAELIASLTESSRALAASYEGMEKAYLDLQQAKADLGRHERQVIMESLFLKITQRLRSPVDSLRSNGKHLIELLPDPSAEVGQTLGELSNAVRQVDGLLKALSRRVAQGGPATPEWLVPQEIFQQELELLQAEGVIPSGVAVQIDDQSCAFPLFGVYSDFAKMLQFIVQHAVGGPTPTGTIFIRAWMEGPESHFEIRDEGGPIPPMGLDTAFEPFSTLHQDAIMDVRSPGGGLPSVRQFLAAYDGTVSIRNEGEGTVVSVVLPLNQSGPSPTAAP
ncbi:response regulator [Holophaga foetida]|uniref:response regulator n=1 Tax=Holophaga foetida TaxID=35839 RepID=UPI00024753A6|nr:response regulator [Holophaga foetida]